MKMMLASALASVPLALAADVTYLATFDGKDKATTWKWRETNDPVMGGRSTGTFTQSGGAGIFNGTCAIVPSLKAPGFCNAITEKDYFKKFPDSSAHIKGSMQLRARTTTPDFAGFKVAFAAKDIPHTSLYGGASFKAGFKMSGDDWQVVEVPLSDFSYDWSGFTGRCDTKDPNGQQHHCCTADDNYKYCPTAKYLSEITDVEIWAEGDVGDYHLEVQWIGMGSSDPAPTTVCKKSEYCCPDAKHCLTPTAVSCASDASVCKDPQVCCPLTKLCVDVGAPCTDPCNDGGYCCPDALHCLTPTNPGVICTAETECKSGEVCCPLTHECVSVGPACTPP